MRQQESASCLCTRKAGARLFTNLAAGWTVDNNKKRVREHGQEEGLEEEEEAARDEYNEPQVIKQINHASLFIQKHFFTYSAYSADPKNLLDTTVGYLK